MSSLAELVNHVGGALPLARALGVTHQAIYPWIKRGWLPTNRALQAASIYNVPHVGLIDPVLRGYISDAATAN